MRVSEYFIYKGYRDRVPQSRTTVIKLNVSTLEGSSLYSGPLEREGACYRQAGGWFPMKEAFFNPSEEKAGWFSILMFVLY